MYFYFVDCLQTFIKMHILHNYAIFIRNSHLLILI